MRGIALVLLLTLWAGGCVRRVEPSGGAPGVGPALSVERFLRASNAGDLEAMARLFGTAEGAIAEARGNALSCFFRAIGSVFGVSQTCLSRFDIERRMDAIARILRHDDYRLTGEEPVPARRHPTTRMLVSLRRGDREYPGVPFVVVRAPDGRWLIEQIGLEQITNPPVR